MRRLKRDELRPIMDAEGNLVGSAVWITPGRYDTVTDLRHYDLTSRDKLETPEMKLIGGIL